jgi:translation initiation factor 2B subunit (eIF-2B alpha/beta/delta family)
VADASPLAAAWRELAEETTLTPTSLSLLRQGKEYTFQDGSVRREWTIFPFLFRLKTPADEDRIRIDWEHEGWAWHDPGIVIRGSRLGGLDGVPRLAESLRRVWFEEDLGPAAGGVLSRGLEALAHDHESGARQLADAALQTLRGVVVDMNAGDCELDEWWGTVRFVAWHLWKNGRESMGASIMSALFAVLARIERVIEKGQGADQWRDAACRELDAEIVARQESAVLISRAFAVYLEAAFHFKRDSHQPISILTLSESSTIRQALRHVALESSFHLHFHILESRPLYEGVSLAEHLVKELSASAPLTTGAHSITLYTDASAALASSNIDLVVLGGDRIAACGDVSNKTGSLPAVLSARHVSPTARIVVLADSGKIALPGRPENHIVEDNDPSGVRHAWQSQYNSPWVRDALKDVDSSDPNRTIKVEIRNVYFEWVQARLIDTYITESGEWTVQQIAEHSAKLETEERRFFGSL